MKTIRCFCDGESFNICFAIIYMLFSVIKGLLLKRIQNSF